MFSGLLLSLTALILPQQDAKADFQKRFNQAIKVNDRVGMDRTVTKYKIKALEVYLEQVERLKWGNPWLDEFINSWKRVNRSEFPAIYGKYLSELDFKLLERRGLAIHRLIPLFALNAEAIGSRTADDWQKIIEVMEPGGLMLEFMDIGDKYYLATCNSILVNCYFKEYRDTGGDDFQAFKAAENFLKLREELEYTNDPTYTNVSRIMADLRATLGIEDPKGKKERVAKESPYAIHDLEGHDWVEVPLKFFTEKKPGKVEHPSDFADMDKLNWRYMGISKAGERSQIFAAYSGDDVLFGGPRGKVFLKRIKSNKFQIEAGGEPSEEFSLAAKPKLILFDQKLSDGTILPQALMVASGSEGESIQGIEVNAGISADGGLMFYRNAAARVGKTPFGELKLFDFDGDGVFGRFPVRVAGSVAMPKEKYFNRFDSITLGNMKRALPFSRWITDRKGSWFELDWPEGAEVTQAKLKKVSPTLAQVKVNVKAPKGLKLTSLILRSETSKTKGLFVDVAGKGPHMIPIGRYRFVQGLLRGDDGEECVIQPATDIPFTLIVEVGEENFINLGGPFKLYAEPVVADGMVSVNTETLRVLGSAGESYMMNLGAPLNGIKVDVKGGKSFELVTPDKEAVALDWHVAFYPLSENTPVPKSGKVEIRLSLKKHPWFGKMSSDWIEE